MKNKCEFLVPLMSKGASRNWGLTCKMLSITLNSLNQITNSEIQITLIGHDFPKGLVLGANCRWLQAQFNPPAGQSFPEKMQDKGKKIELGVVNSFKENKADCIMFVDADDLISNKIFEKIRLNNHDAVCLEVGYEWNLKSNKILKLNNFHKRCGSSWLFRLKKDLFPVWLDQNKSKRLCDQAHQDRLSSLLRNKNSVHICKKPVVTYIVGHGSNSLVENTTKINIKENIKNLIKAVLFSQRISSKLIEEFSLPQRYDLISEV
ncbi:MAG: hypothetical protein KGQ54_03095 [Verrucomicrobia bacterium]|nr:hypothetical protein [Verrucomicrobiota bacterium]